MDDLRIWSQPLDSDAVAALYAAGADAAIAPEAPSGSTVSVTFLMQDSYGDGWNGSTFQIYDADSNIVESHTLAAGNSETVQFDLDAEPYTWAFVNQNWMSEITATLTRDDNSEQLLFSQAGSVLSGAFDLTPATPEISPTLSVLNGEITISAALNAAATDAGATGWAYSLTDIFVVGQAHGGTAMATGASATESPTPHGSHTIYVAAIDDAGLVVVASSAAIDNSPTVEVEISKMDTYGDGWNGTMLVITNSQGVEVYNATLDSDDDTANVPVLYAIDLLVDTYSWELQGGNYPEEQEVTIRLASDGTVLAHSAAHSPSSGSFDITAPAAGDDAGDDGGDDAVDLTSGLVAKYAFDSDGVDSVGSNDGTNANVTFADGAAQFNGSDARFTLASEPFTASDADYTISVWAMHNNLSGNQRLLGWGDTNGRYFVGYHSGRDHIYIGMGDIDIDPTVAYKPVAGQVEHWVFSNSGNTTKFYKDGVLVDTVVHGATGAISAGVGMRIGSVYMEYGEYLNGSMDDLRIWDRQLSDAEVTALYDAGVEVAGGAHDWTFGGQLSNIVKMVKGYDVSGSRSFMFLKNAGGDSDVYITPALADFDAYNLMTSGEHGWSGAPVCGEHGPASCFAFGTSDGNLYKVSLSDYGVPDSSSLIHAFGAGSVNSVNYSPTTQEWIVEHGSKVYTIPYAGGAPSLRMTLPAGSKVVDFAPADDAVALTVQLADFTFARYFALIGWATVHDYTGMAAIVEAIGATDFNYDYDIDMWVAAAADGTIVSTDDINNWLL